MIEDGYYRNAKINNVNLMKLQPIKPIALQLKPTAIHSQ